MPQDIEKRVEILEFKVEALERLPQRMDALEAQIVQLRGEMREGFSALVGETTAIRAHVTHEFAAVRSEAAAFQTEVRAEFAIVRSEAAALGSELRDDIRAGDAETRRYMRVLHEEVLERIKWLGDERRG